MTFTYVSPSVFQQCGYTQKEVVGRRLFDFITPESAKNVRLQMAKGTEQNPGCFSKESEPYILELACKDGSNLVTEVVANPVFNNEDKFTGWRGITRDISRRKSAEEALRLANKKLKLLTGITRHDVKNQLLALQAYITLLETNRSDPKFSDYFHKARNAAEHISAIIAFTKEYESIGVNAPVWQECRTIVETAANPVRLGNVAVKNDIPDKTELFADPLIVKVFYNLMENAIRHGETVTTIRFSAQEIGATLRIVCEDDGSGIPADEKEKIFERGFGKNTGLGLFLSREILSITGIEIREAGEPGKGARFEIIVPQGSYRV
jgi:PAS domain S-box-containing protein